MGIELKPLHEVNANIGYLSPHFTQLAFSFRNTAVVSALPKDQDSDASTVTESRLGNDKGNSVYHLLEESTDAEMAERGEKFYGTSTEARHIRATRDQGMINHEGPKEDPEEGRDSSNGGNKSDGGLFGPNGLLSSWTICLMLVLVALVQVKRASEQSPTCRY